MLNASFVPVIYLFFPETKGLELEDMDRLFSGDNSLAMHGEKEDVTNIEDNKAHADVAV